MWLFECPKFTHSPPQVRGVLTCDDVQISIFRFVVAVLGMLAAVLVDNRLVLNELVFLAEANVTVGVELRNVSRKVLDVNCIPCFASDGYRSFEIDVWRRLWLVGVVQVVIVGVETLSGRFKRAEQ